MKAENWLNYEVSEEEWKLNWRKHLDIIKAIQSEGMRVNLIIMHTEFVFKGEKNYPKEEE
jgi:hypothetical protein